MFTTETIDQTNQSNQMHLATKLLQMSNGMFLTQIINVAANLGIADLLKDGAKSSDELAKLTDVDAKSLYRVLRVLSSNGIFAEGENQEFHLTPLATYLQSDIPGSIRALTMNRSKSVLWQKCENFLDSVKTGGKNPFEMGFLEYMEEHPEKAQMMYETVSAFTTSVIPALLASYDFSPFSKIIDVGGGNGILIAEILKVNPTMKGVLLDLPPLVEGAKHLMEAKGVAQQCEIVGGNFFESLPSGGDAYLLKHIIHTSDDDEDALTILENCHEAMAENATLLVLEAVIPPTNEPSLGHWLDMHMLLMGAGRERTETEYRELLAAAGFKVTKVVYTQSSIDVIEAVKV